MKKSVVISTLVATSFIFSGCANEDKKEEKSKTKEETKIKNEKISELTEKEAVTIAEEYFKSYDGELGIEIEKTPKKINHETYYKARLYSKTMKKDEKNGTIDHVYISKKGVFGAEEYEKKGILEFYHFSLQK